MESIMGTRFRVKSQLESDSEAKKGILDDCGPSSMAACVSWAFKYAHGKDFSAADGVAAKAKATGRVEKQGVSDNGSSLGDLIKTARVLGAEARWATSWEDILAAAKAGAGIGIWVEQPAGYPKGLEISEWHEKWKRWWWVKQKQPNRTYGHMTAAAWDTEFGWQWACPTRSGKGKEQYGVQVDDATIKALLDSKRVSKKHIAPLWKHAIIITAPKGWVAPSTPAPVAPQPVSPQPAAPAKTVPCPACGGTGVKK
jgi:hypothetical protein